MQPFMLVCKKTGQYCTALCVLDNKLMVWRHDDTTWEFLPWNTIQGHYDYLDED